MNKKLIKIGGAFAIVIATLVLFAIAGYFIWPYKGNTASIESIFTILQSDRLGGLIALDISMLIILPFSLLLFFVIYTILKQVDESIALLALILNIIAIVLVIVCRPLVELVLLSDQFALATDTIEKSRILAAGEVLRSQLDGTAWAMQTAIFMIGGLINHSLMLRSAYFKKRTAWTGIIISAIGLPFFLPEIGLIFLFLNTIGTIPWCIFISIDLFKLKKMLS
jgi:hypothetical protein